MKKKIYLGILMSFFGYCAFAQTIVSTTPENRKVILEEFTGINCTFCPQGHAIAQNIQNNNQGDVFLINIHSGGYANPNGNQPDFRTQWGQAIDNQSGSVGYPAGTVNRQNFPGQEQGNNGTTALSRGQWAGAANAVLGENSYANTAVNAVVDVQTRIMTVDVEAFYTDNSPVATNKFNVAVLQNNTLGPQVGGNMGNSYVHQHRLIDLLTGQWGEDITNTTTGSLFSNQYVYAIPDDINGIPVRIEDLEVVVFISETTQYIVSGNGTLPTYTGISSNDINLKSISDVNPTCLGTISPVISIENLGANQATTLDITYSVNQGPSQVYNWTGDLSTFQEEEIALPAIAFTQQATNTLSISVASDDVNENNEGTTSFDAVLETIGTIILTFDTDTFAHQNSWDFRDSSGNIIESESYTSSDDNQLFSYRFNFDADCLEFNMYDTSGNGILGSGDGVSLEDGNGLVIYPLNDDIGSGFSIQFNSDGVLGLEDNNLEMVTLYPNPSSDVLTISNIENATIEIYNLLGQVMTIKTNSSNQETIDVSGYAAGVYMAKISSAGITSTKKFVVVK
ncbi:MAG: T9SS type A sorting domain-containing protein [Patiriisocius sp.]